MAKDTFEKKGNMNIEARQRAEAQAKLRNIPADRLGELKNILSFFEQIDSHQNPSVQGNWRGFLETDETLEDEIKKLRKKCSESILAKEI